MSTFEEKWNAFKKHMISEGYEDFENDHEEMVKDIKTALIAVGFDKQSEQTEQTKKTKKTTKKSKKGKRGPSGYNLFMKAMAEELKATGKKGNVMAVAGPVWKAMSSDEKKVWNDKAKALSPEKALAPEKKPKKLSGYNLFLKEMFAKAKKDGQKGDMKAIGAQWKGLTDAEKTVFKTRADEINAQTAAVA
jgi:hypothetical protein